jgi:hypothetical protein
MKDHKILCYRFRYGYSNWKPIYRTEISVYLHHITLALSLYFTEKFTKKVNKTYVYVIIQNVLIFALMIL